jgi:uncharacterized protein YraI
MLVMSGLMVVSPSPALAGVGATVTADNLNLRVEANTDAGILATMYAGDRVDILYGPFNDGWYEVRFNGQDGYASGEFLAIDGGNAWAQEDGVGASSYVPYSSDSDGEERWIDVDRSSSTVTLYVGDQPQQTFWAAMGWDQSEDGFYATANGSYRVYAKNETLSWTPWANAYITDWIAYDPSRSNGFHSFTRDAAGNVLANGSGPTGGCVALDPWAAEQLFSFADYGTRVEIHW